MDWFNRNELRKEFYVPNRSPIQSPIVFMTGLDYQQFYLNGNQVDPTRKLDPGWTTYEKRTLIGSYMILQKTLRSDRICYLKTKIISLLILRQVSMQQESNSETVGIVHNNIDHIITGTNTNYNSIREKYNLM